MPINTPETDQAIASQEAAKQGDFSAAGLPSPGALPLPQAAPIAYPGTGLTREGSGSQNLQEGNTPVNGTNVDQNFLNKILGAPEKQYKVGNLPTYTEDQAYNPRYRSILPGEDSEEAFAKNQSTGQKWGNAFVKFLGTAVGTMYNGVTAIPSTIAGLKGNNTAYNSENSVAIDQWLKNLENEFPNYYTKWEQAHPFASALPFKGGGFANFWGDKMLKNLGFTVGAIAGAAIQDTVVGAITGGIGEIPLIGNQIGRIALNLNKFFNGSTKIATLGEELAVGSEALLSARNLQRAAAANKIENGTRYAMNLYGAAASEAGFEARDGYNTTRQDLITAYQQEKGYSPYGQDMDDIEKAATSSANTRFAVNLVLLSVSDAIQFDNLLKPWSVAKTGARSTVETELGTAGKVALKQGSIDTFETVKGGKLKRISDFLRPYAADVLSEGVYEEGGQYAAQIGTQNYYERKYIAEHGLKTSAYQQDKSEFDSRNSINEILHSTLEGMKAEFGTTEGKENIFLGALTGVVSKGAKAGYDRLTGKGDIGAKKRQETLNFLNRQGATGLITNLYGSTVQAHRIAQDMKSAVDNNDLFKYKNFQHEHFVNFITSGIQAGRFDVRMAQIDLLRDMKDEEFKKAFGMDKTDANVKTVGEYTDLMKTKAQDIKRTYDLIDDTFQNPYRITRKANLTEKQDENNINHETFESFKKDLTFLASIQADTKRRQASINESVKQIDDRIDMEVLRTLTDHSKLKNYAKTLSEKAELATKSSQIEGSTTKAEDVKRAKLLNDKVEAINKALITPNLTNKAYENLFRDILNYNLTGEDVLLSPADQVPVAAIPKLATYGKDSNRLSIYTQDARDRFEALASEEGFKKYQADVDSGNAKYRDYQDKQAGEEEIPTPPTTPVTPTPSPTQTSPTTTPEATLPKATLTIHSADQHTTRTFEEGNYYPMNVDGRVQNVKVSDSQGDEVKVETVDGREFVVSIDDALIEPELATDINNVIAKEIQGEDITPPTNEVNAQTPKPEDGARKDMDIATRTTVDPEYDKQGIADNNFHKRHQNFLYYLGSTDPKEFNQQNKDNIKAMWINSTLADKMGFPKNWIDTNKFKGVDNEPIRVVYFIQDKEGSFFTDGKGNKLGKIDGGIVNPSKIIYTNMVSTALTYEDGKPRYTNKDNLDEKALQDEWRTKRSQILAIKELNQIQTLNFKVSRGIINSKNDNNQNPVTKIALVTYLDFDRAIISVPTLGSVTPASSGKIAAILDGINFNSGRSLLNPGLTVSWLNSRLISENEAQNLYDLLSYIPQKKSKQELTQIINSMRGMIYMVNPSKGTRTASSIMVQGMNLYLGTETEPIFMGKGGTDGLDTNKDKIINFLKTAYHNVDKSKLEEKLGKEYQVLKVEGGNLIVDKIYKNYQHYLLSDKDPEGKERSLIPLTSNLDIPKQGEVPFIQKYIQIIDEDFNASDFKALPTETEAPVTLNKPTLTSNKAQEQGIKPEIPIPLTLKDLAVNLKDKTTISPYPFGQYTMFLGDVSLDQHGNATDFTVIGKQDNKTKEITKVGKPDVLKGAIMDIMKKSQITQDETNTPPTSPSEAQKPESTIERLKRLKKEGKIQDKGPDAQYRTAFSFGDYIKIDIDKEYDTFKHIVGDKYTLNKLNHLLRKTNGGFAWGAIQANMLHIYNNAPRGTLYHEAFESVWGNYLTGREQQELYDEFKSKEGTFIDTTDPTLPTVKYSDASLYQAKEHMSDLFGNYRVNKDLAEEELKTTPKLLQWFNRLVDFIRKIIFGPQNELNRLFNRMNQGYYRNYSNNIKDITEYSTARGIQLEGLPEYMIQDTIQGMTVEMMQQIFREGADVVDLLDEKPKLAIKTIYDNLLQRLTDYYEGGSEQSLDAETIKRIENLEQNNANPHDIEALGQQADQIKAQWDIIKSKYYGKGGFVEEHIRFLRIFNVEFKIDDNGDVEMDEAFQETGDSAANQNQSEYVKNYLLIDAKQSAATTIKLMLASVADSVWKDATISAISKVTNNDILTKRDNSSVGLPKAAQYAKLFNYLLHSSANIGNIYDTLTHLRDKISDPETRKAIDANVQRVLNKVNFSDTGFLGKTWSQFKTIMKLEGAIVKNKPAYVRQHADELKNVYFRASILNTKLSQTKDQYIAGIKSSDIIVPGSTSEEANFFSVNQKVINKKNDVDFLNSIGIPITHQEFKRLRGNEKTRFNKAVRGIRRTLESAASSKLPIEIISAKGIDFDGRLNELADVYINNISGNDTQSQHPNLDNEQTSSFITNNFVMTVLNDANNSDTKEEFLTKIGNGYLNDIFHRDSYMLNNIMFKDIGAATEGETGAKNKTIVPFTIVEGLETWNGNNKSTSKMAPALRALNEINANNKGIFYTLLPADAVTENAIQTGTFLDPDKFFKQGQDIRRTETNRFTDQMYDWLQTEINLAKDFDNNPNRKNIAALDKTSTFDKTRKVGNSLRFFQDILPKGLVDDIHKNIIDKQGAITTTVDQERFAEIMRSLIFKNANDMIAYLDSWNVIKTVNETQVTVAGIDKQMLNLAEDNGEISDTYNLDSIQRIMAFREMNYMISQIDMHKMFFGDPAQYKDELKRIKSFLSGRDLTHVDILQDNHGANAYLTNERNKAGNWDDKNNMIMLKPGDPGYKAAANHFNTLTFEDVFSASDDDRVDYDHNNVADAQAHIMPTAYRELMNKAQSRFTEAQEAQFQRNMAKTRLLLEEDGHYTYTDASLKAMDEKLSKEKNDSNVAFQPLKIIHSGIQDVNSTAVASLDKASWAMVDYTWARGTNLGKLYIEMFKKGIDYTRMESAHKVGTQTKSLTSFYDNKGNFNQTGVQESETEQVQLKHLGIQVEQNKKEKGQTEGSQARKVVTSNIMSNGVPIDFSYDKGGKSIYSNQTEAEAEWDKLDEAQKEQKSKLYKKVKRYDRAVAASVNVRVNNLMRKLGIVPDEDNEGLYTIPNKEKISKFIFRELERRELPRNIAYGLEIDPQTQDFKIPLEANAQYQKIRQIIYSIIESTVQRPKFNGGQKTMVSILGMESGSRVIKKMVNGKPVYTSSLLKFYRKNENGKSTTACEIMLPYYFAKKINEMQERSAKQGKKVPFRTKEEILEYLNTTQEGKELLKGIGFRIPTQGLNSMDFFVIKDFLPENMGDSIIFPAEITTKAGSDFDIDKMNVYLKNFYIDRNDGYPKMTRFENINTNDEQALKDYYEKYLLEPNKRYNEFIKKQDLLASSSKLMTSIADKANTNLEDDYEDDEEPDYVPTLDEFILENKGKSSYELNNKEAIENEYMDAMEDLLSDSHNYNALTHPNDASQLKKLRDNIVELFSQRDKAEEEIKSQTFGKMLNSLFMMKERHAYLASKNVVGIAAIANTFHSLSQGMQGALRYIGRGGFKIRAPHNQVAGDVSLSGLSIKGHDNILISDVISQIIDGGVDVTKDKFLAEMGIDRETLPVVLALIRAGVAPRWAVTFINQPIIQEYLKRKAINDSIPDISRKVYKQRVADLKASVLSDSRFNKPNDRVLRDFPDTYAISEMEDMIKSPILNADQRARQQQIYTDFHQYVQMGWDLFNFYNGYNWDTGNFSDPNTTRMKNVAYRRADGNDIEDERDRLPMTRVSKLVNNSFLGAMRKGVFTLDSGFKSIIKVQRGIAGRMLNRLARDMTKWYGAGMSVKQKSMLKYELSMVDYAIQNNGKDLPRPPVDYMNDLLLTKNNPVTKYIYALQNSNIKSLRDNPFIKNILPSYDAREGYPSTFRLKDRDYDTYTSNVWTDAWRELKNDQTIIAIDNNPDNNRTVSSIYKMLVLGSILQYGGRRSSFSMTHLIPNESYSQYARGALQIMNLSNYDEVGAFYRNNFKDPWIVPSVDPDTPIGNSGQYTFTGAHTTMTNQLFKQDHGQDSRPPSLLNLSDWNAKGRGYVKVYNEVTKKAELFQLVHIEGINGPEAFRTVKNRSVYKRVNPWGDGNNIQEYHQNAQISILSGINSPVTEYDDVYITELFQRANNASNANVSSVSQAITTDKEITPTEQQNLVSTSEATDEGDTADQKIIEEQWTNHVRNVVESVGGTLPQDRKVAKFLSIRIEDVKIVGKKSTFDENEGYLLRIANHPDMAAYVYKDGDGDWTVMDSKTGRRMGEHYSTRKGAVSNAIEKLNKFGTDPNISPELEEQLSKAGLTRKYDEPDRDLGKCK